MRTIVAKEKLNCEHLLGTFLDESHYDTIIDEDCMFFAPPPCGTEKINCAIPDCSTCEKGIDEDQIMFVLKKGFFTEEEQLNALEGLKGAAHQSQNRGIAAGPRGEKLQGREWVTDFQLEILDYFLKPEIKKFEDIYSEDEIELIKEKYKNGDDNPSTRGFVWLTSKTHPIKFNFNEWLETTRNLEKSEQIKEAERVKDFISNTNYAMPVFSGVAGYMGRYPRIPYGRATSYTEKNPEKFKLAFPLLQKLSAAFSTFLPRRFNFQKSCTEKIDPRFYVPGTVFTTITVNKTFRTAAHRDAGDLFDGFSNLCVLTNGKNYSGGYLVLPEFRAAVNVRPGDLLLIANHTGIHGNTPIILEEEGAERYSVVCYFREDMLELGSKEYEDTRFNFIESRRTNKEHPEWRPLWNGISQGVWESSEWYEYLKNTLGEDELYKYHPSAKSQTLSLEEFF